MMRIEILNSTPSFIQVRVDTRTVSIQGESFLPGNGSPDFVIFANAVHWEPPFERELIEGDVAIRIVEKVAQILRGRNWNVIVE